MNRTALKNYAPQARRAFIQAATDRAAYYGLTTNKIEPVLQKGDVAVIGGREHPRAVAGKRKQLEERITRHGFEPTMEAVAYTWFNRLVAIRFMELHGYLEHGYRVLSHPEGKATPEILEQAEHVALVGLKHDVVVDLKLAGNKEDELYRLLLTAQCNALHAAMPFLFERIDDETELLLPSNLLNSDSLVRKLVGEIDEQDWQQVEIIGWLYQFYISEKKDEVIGKVVASEDIPAATQLFTPNWIVKYLVQNTLGTQWLATYPQSALRQQMEYYIEPAEQTFEVQQELMTITPTSLNPEEMTLLDPACGSGHILVEAYDLFKAIYQERGYRAKDIPALILEKNLFGLEIDDRAAQLAAFSLMMKARADERRIFDSHVKPNILAFQDSSGLNASVITQALNAPIDKKDVPREYLFEEIQEDKDGLFSKRAMAERGHVSQADIAILLELFDNAKTFGSLIQVPPKLAAKLPEISKRAEHVLKHGNLTHASAHVIEPLLQQANLLARRYHLVVENPPYCGSRYMTPSLAVFARTNFKAGSGDLFAAFVLRSVQFVESSGFLGVVCPFVWMFIATYEDFRRSLFASGIFDSMVRLEYNSFEPACVPVSTWVYSRRTPIPHQTQFVDLTEFKGIENQAPRTLEAIATPSVSYRYSADCSEFLQIPTASFAYAVSAKFRRTFSSNKKLGDLVDFTGSQNITGKNNTYVRLWWEISSVKIGERNRWVFYSKGGGNRKWWGLLEDVVDWSPDARRFYSQNKTSNLLDERFWFRPGVMYSMLTSQQATFRLFPRGALYDKGGPAFHPLREELTEVLLSLCNSSFADRVFDVLNPTLNLQVQDVKSVPVASVDSHRVSQLVRECILLARQDWDSSETSWDFQSPVVCNQECTTLQRSQELADSDCNNRFHRLKELEEENDRLWIDAHGLQAELLADASDEKVSSRRPDRQGDIKRLISYAMGCMMGRYSIDKPGLIFAGEGNEGFNPGHYRSIHADDDGIIPLLDTDWGFPDDAANRLVEFISVVWPEEGLEQNVKFVAESLGLGSNEQPRETIRRYLATGYYKQHLTMYRKRPIYWLFSSGKHRAFQCLVYLHRYHEGTLARMRTEYVIPLQGQIAARIDQLEGDKAKATSTSHRNKLQKEQTDLKKQQAELRIFEEKLRHLADEKITLDLDDGVKVNYAKFGDLLADSKVITGGKDDE